MIALLVTGCLLDREGYEAARAFLTDDDGDAVSEHDGDCDDTDPSRYPGAQDICDGVDNDCDGDTDEDGGDRTWYLDLDGDGYGDEDAPNTACDPGEGWIALGADCDDTRASVHPDATETCDGEDEDCDGAVDDNVDDAPTWYVDADADGYTSGSAGAATECDEPDGYSEPSEEDDCDDADGTVFPGAAQVCGDGVVNDCRTEDECRYEAASEPHQRLVESDLSDLFVQTAIMTMDGDDAADIVLGRVDLESSYFTDIRMVRGPIAGTTTASAATWVWDTSSDAVDHFWIGLAGEVYPEILATVEDTSRGDSLRRLGAEGGVMSPEAVWLQGSPGASLAKLAFGRTPGRIWVGETGTTGGRLLAVDHWTAMATATADVGSYVETTDTELELAPAVCDLDADGVDDVVLSQLGAISLIPAVLVEGAVDIADVSTSMENDGAAQPACADDLTGDGQADLLISIFTETDEGTVYLLSDFPGSGSVEATAATAFAADGATRLGFDVSTGDLDDDGVYDIAAGAPFGQASDFGGGTGSTDGGCAVLFYGPFGSGTRSATDEGGAAFCSAHDNSYFGYNVAMADDITGDGIDDLVSTAILETASDGVSQGIVYGIPGLTW